MKRMMIHGMTAAIALVLLVVLPGAAQSAQAAAADFTFQRVIDQAKQLAGERYVPPAPLPDLLRNMTYDEWRTIRQRRGKAYWHAQKLPFELQFFHPGFVYDRTVKMNAVTPTGVVPIVAERSWFDYGGLPQSPQIPEQVGLAGFRVHTAIKTTNYLDEFLVFLGGSYLRAVGKDDAYGLSARGLALDTASPHGEEFPWFREFWIVQPKPTDSALTIFALLDSQRVTGAYRYNVVPGQNTIINVSSHLFFREAVDKLGIAPLTSMYFFGENNPLPGIDDFRPEVHDSDGLLIHFGSGEWLWRPLSNGRLLQVNGFKGLSFKGFGLLQRDKNFDHYQDLEARYEKRPGLWIEPLSEWGPGRVELIQIPTKDEIHDNVVAFFVPDVAPQAGSELQFDYRMWWGGGSKIDSPGTRVVATRIGREEDASRYRFVIDFTGADLKRLSDDQPVEAVVSAGAGGRVVIQTVQKNPLDHSWRLVFVLATEPKTALDKVLPDNGRGIEVRAFLKNGPDVISETWSYLLGKKGGQ